MVNDLKILIISNIPPNRVTNLLIPIIDANDANVIEILNLQEKNITLQSNKLERTALSRAVSSALLTVTISILIYGLMNLRVLIKNQEENNKNKKLLRDVERKLEIEVERLGKVENREAKARLYLIIRLTDLQKETTFWRDTIRKILYNQTKDKKTAELLFVSLTISPNIS